MMIMFSKIKRCLVLRGLFGVKHTSSCLSRSWVRVARTLLLLLRLLLEEKNIFLGDNIGIGPNAFNEILQHENIFEGIRFKGQH